MRIPFTAERCVWDLMISEKVKVKMKADVTYFPSFLLDFVRKVPNFIQL
jgi:hypothetical protein